MASEPPPLVNCQPSCSCWWHMLMDATGTGCGGVGELLGIWGWGEHGRTMKVGPWTKGFKIPFPCNLWDILQRNQLMINYCLTYQAYQDQRIAVSMCSIPSTFPRSWIHQKLTGLLTCTENARDLGSQHPICMATGPAAFIRRTYHPPI